MLGVLNMLFIYNLRGSLSQHLKFHANIFGVLRHWNHTPNCSELLLALCLGVTFSGPRESHGKLRIELRVAVCKTNILLDVLTPSLLFRHTKRLSVLLYLVFTDPFSPYTEGKTY